MLQSLSITGCSKYLKCEIQPEGARISERECFAGFPTLENRGQANFWSDMTTTEFYDFSHKDTGFPMLDASKKFTQIQIVESL